MWKWIVPLVFAATMMSPTTSFGADMKIKVLILEDSYAVPGKDERLEIMGRSTGDLLMNGTHYSGNIEVWRGAKGLYLVNELPLEEYVENVVAAEVGGNWDLEALKAQAVISRTYAIYKKLASGNPRYDITSSVLHQAYKGGIPQIQVSFAVRETAGEILTYEGKPIEALYHSTSGGKTENAEEVFGKSYPYMKSVESNCELSPYWVWERKIPKEEIEKALNMKGIKGVSIQSYTATGRAKELLVERDSDKAVMKATEFRKLLGWSRLPSTNFSVRVNGTSITFEGKGYGHGVGLCQWSSLQMAKDGKTYKEILSFFYPGTVLTLYEGY